jgi:hypothetical protein
VRQQQSPKTELVPREVEVEARADAALIKGLMRRTAEDVITIGQALIRQKAALPHGSFLPWIDSEYEMTARTSQNFMRVAEQFGAKYETVSHLAPKALYELASSTAEVQAEVERRIAAGEIVSASGPARTGWERAGPSQSAGLASDPTGEVMMRSLRVACPV